VCAKRASADQFKLAEEAKVKRQGLAFFACTLLLSTACIFIRKHSTPPCHIFIYAGVKRTCDCELECSQQDQPKAGSGLQGSQTRCVRSSPPNTTLVVLGTQKSFNTANSFIP